MISLTTSQLAPPRRWRRPHWRILCYHGVPDGCADNFERQLQSILDIGFRFVTLTEGLRVSQESHFSAPIATVTFDDVEETAFTNALPILNRLGIRAMLYIASDYVRTGVCYRTAGKPRAISPEQILLAAEIGHEVGAHTVTHAPLKYCTEERARQELRLSKDLLQEWFRREIQHFSYPWGQHSQQTRSLIMQSAMFKSAATIERGMMFGGEDPYAIRRDSICPKLMSPACMVRIMARADLWYWAVRLVRPFKRRRWRSLDSWQVLSNAQLIESSAYPAT
jgi:peptidoglycan/xylan/chitin deacetylase (PgdA/CDA1 family)